MYIFELIAKLKNRKKSQKPIDEESQEIIDAKFKAFGSPVIIACSNVACELLIGKHISDAKKISHVTLINVLGELPVDKIPTIKMVEKTIAETIKIYEKNN